MNRRPEWVEVDGERLRALRRERGLTQEALAGQARVSPGTVARLERQPLPRCRDHTLNRLAIALGQEPAALARPLTSTADTHSRHGADALTARCPLECLQPVLSAATYKRARIRPARAARAGPHRRRRRARAPAT